MADSWGDGHLDFRVGPLPFTEHVHRMLPDEHVTPPLHALLVMELQSLEPLQEHCLLEHV